MVVEVPRLQRIQSAQPVKADRLNFQVRDQSQIIQQQTGNLAKLASEGIELYNDVEDNKINQLSNEAENEYNVWNAEQLNKLRTIKGDPTDAYVAYETAEKEKSKEILNSRPDLNDRVKRHVASNFNKVQTSQRVQVLKQRGLQQETYENNLFESTVKLQTNDLPVNAGFIRKEDSATFLPFDNQVQTIKDTIVKRGLRDGTAKKLDKNAKSWGHLYTDGDGQVVKVQVSDIAKQRIAKELSGGISNSIKVMIDSGYSEEAKMVMDKYENSIDPVAKASLQKKFSAAKVKDEAFANFDKVSRLTPEKQVIAIDKIKDPEVRFETLKIKEADDNRRESQRDRKSENNYDRLANQIIDKMGSSNPYHGVAQLESDPIYKQTWDNITDPKQKKAVLELLKPPKESSQGSQIEVQNLLYGTHETLEIETMTPAKFETMIVNLNEKDKGIYRGEFRKLKKDTKGEQRSFYKRANSLLTEQLIAVKYVRPGVFGLDTRDNIKVTKAKDDLLEKLSEYVKPGPLQDKDLQNFVKEYAVAKKKGEVFSPTPREIFGIATKKDAIDKMTNVDKKPFFRKYRKENGSSPSPSELNNYIREQVKK